MVSKMNSKLSWLVTGILCLLHAIAAKTIGSISNEDANESERIIMGKAATPGQFKYACAVYYTDFFICTCSIISPNIVLTAAHCVDLFGNGTQPADLFYAIANVNRKSPTLRINFKDVTRHPMYDPNSIENDVAFFTTTEPIQFTDDVKPVCIAGPNTPAMQYRSAIAMGWGKTTDFDTFFRNIRQLFPFLPSLDPTPPEILQYTKQTIVSQTSCNLAYMGGINEKKICANGFFSGICSGDSGGPLVATASDGRPVQIGIASYINGLVGCGRNFPAVWTRVSSFYDYIMQTSNDSSICSI